MQRSTIVAIVAVSLALGDTHFALPSKASAVDPRPPVTVHVQGKTKHSWGDLTDDEKRRLVEVLRSVKGQTIQIVCGGATCRDLAEDLDDVFEDVGAQSSVQTPMIDMGHGIGIAPSNEVTKLIASQIAAVTNGRLQLEVKDQDVKGAIIIAIARTHRVEHFSAPAAQPAPIPHPKPLPKKK